MSFSPLSFSINPYLSLSFTLSIWITILQSEQLYLIHCSYFRIDIVLSMMDSMFGIIGCKGMFVESSNVLMNKKCFISLYHSIYIDSLLDIINYHRNVLIDSWILKMTIILIVIIIMKSNDPITMDRYFDE